MTKSSMCSFEFRTRIQEMYAHLVFKNEEERKVFIDPMLAEFDRTVKVVGNTDDGVAILKSCFNFYDNAIRRAGLFPERTSQSGSLWLPYVLSPISSLASCDSRKVERVLDVFRENLQVHDSLSHSVLTTNIHFSVYWLNQLGESFRRIPLEDVCRLTDEEFSHLKQGVASTDYKDRVRSCVNELRRVRTIKLDDMSRVAMDVFRTVGGVDVDVKARGEYSGMNTRTVLMPRQFFLCYDPLVNRKLFDVSCAFYAACFKYGSFLRQGFSKDEEMVFGFLENSDVIASPLNRAFRMVELARLTHFLSLDFKGASSDLSDLLNVFIHERRDIFSKGYVYGTDPLEQSFYLLLSRGIVPDDFYLDPKIQRESIDHSTGKRVEISLQIEAYNSLVTDIWNEVRRIQRNDATIVDSYKLAKKLEPIWVKNPGLFITTDTVIADSLCLPDLCDMSRAVAIKKKDAARRVISDSRKKGESFLNDSRKQVLPIGKERENLIGCHFVYPEWDSSKKPGEFKSDYCIVGERVGLDPNERASDYEVGLLRIDESLLQRIQDGFELLKPAELINQRRLLRGRLDHRAAMEYRVALINGQTPDPRVYRQKKLSRRSVAAVNLLDMSGTSGFESGIDRLRIIDVERQAMWYVALGLEKLGDNFGLYGCWSGGRHNCQFRTFKDLDEPFDSQKVWDSVQRIKPMHSSRFGAAIRHATAKLAVAPEKTKLLFFWSDGLPQDERFGDESKYEGLYGMIDTKSALLEARAQGIHTFGYLLGSKVDPRFYDKMFSGYFTHITDLSQFPERFAYNYRRLTE